MKINLSKKMVVGGGVTNPQPTLPHDTISGGLVTILNADKSVRDFINAKGEVAS